jgi:hypothetical protein
MKMKFGKLLASGKSWVGYPGTGRYQMREALHLPKFISPKNPFKQEAVAQPSAPPVAAAAPAMPSPAALVASPILVEAPVSAESPAVLPAAVASTAVAKVSWQARAGGITNRAGELTLRVGEWLKRAAFFCLDHNPFSAIGKPKLAGIPRFGKSAVQGELSLDRVKVVRNDLSHADLEVVGQK